MTEPTQIELRYREQVVKYHRRLLKDWVFYLSLLSYHRPYVDLDATVFMRSITLLPLEWRANDSVDFEPRFSRPFTSEKIDKLYARTRATNYPRDPWSTYPEGNPDTTEHMMNGIRAASYMRDLIGHYERPFYIAGQTDWAMFYNTYYTDLYDHIESEANFLGWPLRVMGIFRALPWPQESLPTDPEELALLREQISEQLEQSVGYLHTTIDEAFRRPGQRAVVHLAALIVDKNEPREDEVLRTEMLVALSLMRDQMSRKINYRTHLIFPVFVYAFAGANVRVLQVHLEPWTRKLIVRKTSYIRLSGPENVDEVKLLLSWMTATPIGKTSYDDFDLNMEDVGDSDLRQAPPSPKKRAIGVSQG